MRMEWINEGRPRDSVHEESIFDDPVPEPREREKSQTASRVAPIFEPRQSDRTKTPQPFEEEDIYGVSPFPKKKQSAPVKSLFGGGDDDDVPEDDDLDALFGEDEIPAAGKAAELAADAPDDDDLDALFAEENTTNTAPSNPKTVTMHNEFDDDEEALAEMDMDLPW